MNEQIHAAAAKGFQLGADAYERGRPEYPVEAVQRLARELGFREGKLALDLGAGTGKFTKLLAAASPVRVLAVEPVEGMRKKFSSLLPALEILDGTAEKIPLPAVCADAVTVAQAFHWFSGERALAEIHRVLKPGGFLGLIWNSRDESRPWVAKLTEIIDPHEGGAPRYKSGQWKTVFKSTPLFRDLQSAEFQHEHRGTPETVVDRVASISFIAALPDLARAQVLSEVRALLQSNPETRGKAEIDFPYRTDIFWCQRK